MNLTITWGTTETINNVVLKNGVLGYNIDTTELKIGNGTDTFNKLPIIGIGSLSDLIATINTINNNYVDKSSFQKLADSSINKTELDKITALIKYIQDAHSKDVSDLNNRIDNLIATEEGDTRILATNIDEQLSNVSTNPVQNSVITAELNKKIDNTVKANNNQLGLVKTKPFTQTYNKRYYVEIDSAGLISVVVPWIEYKAATTAESGLMTSGDKNNLINNTNNIKTLQTTVTNLTKTVESNKENIESALQKYQDSALKTLYKYDTDADFKKSVVLPYTVTIQEAGTNANRYFPIESDNSGNLFVNIPYDNEFFLGSTVIISGLNSHGYSYSFDIDSPECSLYGFIINGCLLSLQEFDHLIDSEEMYGLVNFKYTIISKMGSKYKSYTCTFDYYERSEMYVTTSLTPVYCKPHYITKYYKDYSYSYNE